MKDKLHPDAEAALRKLLLEIWSFQTFFEEMSEEEYDSKYHYPSWDEKNNCVNEAEPTIHQRLSEMYIDGLLNEGLSILGFDSVEDLEESVWAKKPEEAAAS